MLGPDRPRRRGHHPRPRTGSPTPTRSSWPRASPSIVETKEEDGFVLTAEALKAHITPGHQGRHPQLALQPDRARPTPEAQLQALADVVRGEDIYVVADEIYASLVYDDFPFTSFAALGEDIKKKTVIINGPSKSYSMTGWRIGYAARPGRRHRRHGQDPEPHHLQRRPRSPSGPPRKPSPGRSSKSPGWSRSSSAAATTP